MALRRVPRNLKIDRDIARLLSKATYHRFVLALRELVANSHDASASKIEIKIKLSNIGIDSLEVKDDGDGMNEDQFNQEFLSLGSTSKKPKESGGPQINRFGRQIIGQFGIGFISSIPFANEVIVETRDLDSSMVHGAKINCREILEGTTKGTETSFELDGWNRPPDSSEDKTFTRVSLQGLTKQAYDSIDSTIQGGWYQYRRQRKLIIGNGTRIEFLRNWASRILPLGYDEVKVSDDLGLILKGLLPEKYIPALMLVNEKPVSRLLAEDVMIEGPFELNGPTWRARGVLWSPRKTITPVYTRGIAIRIGDMSIGEPSYLGLSEVGRVYGKLQHIAGEIHVEGLQSDLQLDRQYFYYTQATSDFLEQVRKRITSFESKLQKPAHVMQKFRNLNKAIKKTKERTSGKEKVAPILEASKLLEQLEKEARESGIQVKKSPGSNLEVPSGEKSVDIGTKVAEELLQIRFEGKPVKIVITEKQSPMNIDSIIASIKDTSSGRIIFSGPHRLISDDEWAQANVRWLITLQGAYRKDRLTEEQIRWIIEKVTETFGVEK